MVVSPFGRHVLHILLSRLGKVKGHESLTLKNQPKLIHMPKKLTWGGKSYSHTIARAVKVNVAPFELRPRACQINITVNAWWILLIAFSLGPHWLLFTCLHTCSTQINPELVSLILQTGVPGSEVSKASSDSVGTCPCGNGYTVVLWHTVVQVLRALRTN